MSWMNRANLSTCVGILTHDTREDVEEQHVGLAD